mgnify:CR=1 FL=1
MNIVNFLSHIILPRYTNNFKAKLLHNSSLLFLSIILLAVHLLTRALSTPQLSILGYAANISPHKIVDLTNRERLKAGVNEVSYSEVLSHAASMKARDMIEKDYWAHVSPDGTEPWDFFHSVGYVYRYAGENLARDFSDEKSTVEAWLASPSHRENMLSGRYSEIGVAVVEGDLNGKDTTLIVQFFGTPSGAAPVIPVAAAESAGRGIASENSPILAQTPEINVPAVPASGFDVMKVLTLMIIGALVWVLVIDVIVISKRGITRVGGRTFAHLSFMMTILVILILVKSGEII